MRDAFFGEKKINMRALFSLLFVHEAISLHARPCQPFAESALLVEQLIHENFVQIATLRNEIQNLRADLERVYRWRARTTYNEYVDKNQHESTKVATNESAIEPNEDFYRDSDGAVSEPAQKDEEYNPLPWSTVPVSDNANDTMDSSRYLRFAASSNNVTKARLEPSGHVEQADEAGEKASGLSHTAEDEMTWLRAQAGMVISTDLLDRIHHNVADIALVTITTYNAVCLMLTLFIMYSMIRQCIAHVQEKDDATDVEQC